MKNLSFVAIDFEKLNTDQTSVCEIGLVRFVDGIKIEEFSSLIKPYKGFERNRFGENKLKRITDENLLTAPTYMELYPKIKDFIGDSVIVCHQVNADINYIYNLQNELGVEDLYHAGYIDTMSITNDILGIGGLAESYQYIFGKPMKSHHSALADALACGELLIALSNKIDTDKYLHTERYIASKDRSIDYHTRFGTTNVGTDGLVYYDDAVELNKSFWKGKTIVLSGIDVKSGKRYTIKEFINSCGGKCVGSLSKKTDVFLTGSTIGPSKKVQAKDLQQGDGKLIIISLYKFESVFGKM